MKVLLYVSLLIIVSLPCNAQKLPSPFEYKIIDSIADMGKGELFSRANKWIIGKAIGKNTVKLLDKDNGQLIGNFKMKVPNLNHVSGTDIVDYSIFIDIKEGRYRIVFSNFTHEKGISLNDESIKLKFGMSGSAPENWRKIRVSADEQTQAMISDFKSFMRTTMQDDF